VQLVKEKPPSSHRLFSCWHRVGQLFSTKHETPKPNETNGSTNKRSPFKY